MRKAWIPENWVLSGLSDAAFRTVSVLALHKDKANRVYLTNDKLAMLLSKDVRRIQSDINQAIQIGLIERNFDTKGKRYFTLLVDKNTGDEKRQGVTPSDMTENVTPCRPASSGDDVARQGGMTPSVTSPKNPYIGINLLLQSTSTNTNTNAGGREAERPQAPDTECVSVLGETSLPQGKPKTEISEDIKRMASQLQLESWINELIFQGESLDDWRVRETLGVIFAQGGKKGSRYAWGIYRNLPKDRPAATDFVQNAKVIDEQRKARNLARLEALK